MNEGRQGYSLASSLKLALYTFENSQEVFGVIAQDKVMKFGYKLSLGLIDRVFVFYFDF